jgi:vitamin B12 transporter
MKWTSIVFKSVCLFALTSAIAWAQGSSVAGLVKDPSGAAVPNATVVLEAQDNTTSLQAVSNHAGRYRFEHLSPGQYLISAKARGLQSSSVKTIEVNKDKSSEVELPLSLVAVTNSVMVTASGTAQATDEAAKSISIADSETIQNLDINTVADALSYVPGLRIQRQGGPGGLVSIKTRGLRNQDTAVLIDGFRFRDVTGTQGDASGLLQDPLITDTDRIEVLRGTGSSICGTDATGGVINIITGMGGGKTRGSVRIEGGSLGTFRGQAAASGSVLHSRLGYSLGVAHLNVTRGLDGNLADRTTNTQGMFDYAISDKTRVFGRMFFADSYGRMTQSPSVIKSGTGAIAAIPLSGAAFKQYENGTPLSSIDTGSATFIPDFDDPDQHRATRTYSGALIVTSHPTNSLALTADYQGLATNRNFINGPLGQGYQPYGGTEILNYDGTTHAVSGRFDWQVGKYQSINAGYEFENEHAFNGDTEPDPTESNISDVTQRNHAFFVQDQVHLLDGRLQLAGSYRLQLFNLQTPSLKPTGGNPYSGIPVSNPPTSSTGDASAAYLFPASGTKLRIHAGNGYRAPSLYERFGSWYYMGFSAVGDPRLKPERTRAIDGGIDQTFWQRRAVASATYFYTRLNEVISYNYSLPTADPYGRYSGYVNTHGGIARGIESSFAISPFHQLNIRTAYTFTNARENTPSIHGIYQTFVTPDHQFSLLATGQLTPNLAVVFGTVITSNYLYPISGQAFRFNGLHRGQFGTNYRRPLSGSHAVRFFVNVNNAFNQTYYESGYRTPDATAMSGVQFDF